MSPVALERASAAWAFFKKAPFVTLLLAGLVLGAGYGVVHRVTDRGYQLSVWFASGHVELAPAASGLPAPSSAPQLAAAVPAAR